MEVQVPRHERQSRILIACAGAAVALTMGVTTGGAMKPQLVTDQRPAGPQILMGELAERSTGPFDDSSVSVASYGSHLPDYVLGTDMQRQVDMAAAEAAEPEPAVQPILEHEIPVEEAIRPIETVRPEEPEALAEPVSYPSIDGGRDFDRDLPVRPADDVASTRILAASDY